MRYIIIIFFVFIQVLGNGQVNTPGVKDVNNNLFEPNFRVRPKGYPAKLDGSGMLFEKGVKGYLVLKDKSRTSIVEVNYNMLVEETVIDSEKGKFLIQNQFIDSLVCVNQGQLQKYVFANLKGDDQVRIWKIEIDGQ